MDANPDDLSPDLVILLSFIMLVIFSDVFHFIINREFYYSAIRIFVLIILIFIVGIIFSHVCHSSAFKLCLHTVVVCSCAIGNSIITVISLQLESIMNYFLSNLYSQRDVFLYVDSEHP